MSRFPTTFAETAQPLPAGLSKEADIAAAELAEKGFTATAGLSRYYARSAARMATEPHIREYCPRDATWMRFATEDSTEQWLGRDEGAAPFLLLKAGRLAGYGWTRPQKNEHVPGGETTFAVRIGAWALGKRLAAPFSRLIVAGTKGLRGGNNIWLETWQSNQKAVRSYKDIGFEQVGSEPGDRPSLRLPRGVRLPDTRLYMAYTGE